jgi:rare lipoprotein A
VRQSGGGAQAFGKICGADVVKRTRNGPILALKPNVDSFKRQRGTRKFKPGNSHRMKLHLAAALCGVSFLLAIPAANAQSGIASVYAHSGGKTASGERVAPGAFTAAHRSLPFGTRVRVTNRRNGRSIIVRINDRGPFVRGRIIDLSPAAARALGFSGLASVSVDVVS